MNISNYAVGTTHLGLPTACYDETVSFYQGLGFTEAFSMTFDDGERLIFLRLKGLLLEIYESSQCAGVPGAVDHIAIDVTDIESVFDAIKAEGYPVTTPLIVCNTDDYAAVAAKASGTVKQGDALLELKH